MQNSNWDSAQQNRPSGVINNVITIKSVIHKSAYIRNLTTLFFQSTFSHTYFICIMQFGTVMSLPCMSIKVHQPRWSEFHISPGTRAFS